MQLASNSGNCHLWNVALTIMFSLSHLANWRKDKEFPVDNKSLKAKLFNFPINLREVTKSQPFMVSLEALNERGKNLPHCQYLLCISVSNRSQPWTRPSFLAASWSHLAIIMKRDRQTHRNTCASFRTILKCNCKVNTWWCNANKITALVHIAWHIYKTETAGKHESKLLSRQLEYTYKISSTIHNLYLAPFYLKVFKSGGKFKTMALSHIWHQRMEKQRKSLLVREWCRSIT